MKIKNPNHIVTPDPDSPVEKYRDAVLQCLRTHADQADFDADQLRDAMGIENHHLLDSEIAAICADAGIVVSA